MNHHRQLLAPPVEQAALLAPPTVARAVACPVAGFGIVRANAELLSVLREPPLRRNPVPLPGEALAANFLKHASEQTVAGLAAVYQAIHNFQLTTDFSAWAALAAPCFLGRSALAQALARFETEGAWGISPHLIPHQSLHAVSGTISQALGIRGPNFGVGGAPAGIVEALLVAASLMAAGNLPGLWLVLTDYEPELIPADPKAAAPRGPYGQPERASRQRQEWRNQRPEEPVCVALALALVPHAARSIGLTLQLCVQDDSSTVAYPAWTSWAPLEKVADLARAFSQDGICQGNWRLGPMGWVKLQIAASGGNEPGLESEA